VLFIENQYFITQPKPQPKPQPVAVDNFFFRSTDF